MKIVRWVSTVGILVGLGILHFRFTAVSASNWSPVSLPLPSVGYVAGGQFHIDNGGRFRVEVSSPFDRKAVPLSVPEIPPVECKLHIRIRDDKDFSMERKITALRRSAQSLSCGIEYFVSDPFILPHRGDYFVEVESTQDIVHFRDVGAMFSVSRFEQPIEASIRRLLFSALAYPLIFLSLGGLVLSGVFCERSLKRVMVQGSSDAEIRSSVMDQRESGGEE